MPLSLNSNASLQLEIVYCNTKDYRSIARSWVSQDPEVE